MTLSAYLEGLFLRRFAYNLIAHLTPFSKIFSFNHIENCHNVTYNKLKGGRWLVKQLIDGLSLSK